MSAAAAGRHLAALFAPLRPTGQRIGPKNVSAYYEPSSVLVYTPPKGHGPQDEFLNNCIGTVENKITKCIILL